MEGGKTLGRELLQKSRQKVVVTWSSMAAAGMERRGEAIDKP